MFIRESCLYSSREGKGISTKAKFALTNINMVLELVLLQWYDATVLWYGALLLQQYDTVASLLANAKAAF